MKDCTTTIDNSQSEHCNCNDKHEIHMFQHTFTIAASNCLVLLQNLPPLVESLW